MTLSVRLVELAPPYFLSNLPPSESRDLLNQLREGMADSSTESESFSPQQFRDACILQ
jgi:ATP-dependent RNA helicase DQX1